MFLENEIGVYEGGQVGEGNTTVLMTTSGVASNTRQHLDVKEAF